MPRDWFAKILNEVKANGIGDNKNVLIELNIEQTRHNEIQLLGNGEWAIALGGRDCSLQMHEQKLLEISVTQEALAEEIAKAKKAGLKAQAEGPGVGPESPQADGRGIGALRYRRRARFRIDLRVYRRW